MIKRVRNWSQFVIRIYNEDFELLQLIQNKLIQLGLRAYIHIFRKKNETRNYEGRLIIYNKDYYALEISNKKDVINLLQKLAIKHSSKVEKAKQVLTSSKTT